MRQGDAVTATLFNNPLEVAVGAAELERTKEESSLYIVAYAGELVMMAKDGRNLEDAVRNLANEAATRRSVINQSKTKRPISSRRGK